MINLRKSSERGHADHGWLESFHSFSFADYHDPDHMGFGALRVINEDRIAPGTGFGTHSHRDMEIISYVLAGELAHKDSMGTGTEVGGPSGVIRPGDVQRMSAGSGVRHSEFNHAPAATTHFLQIWIEPDVRGIEPSYEQTHFDAASKRGQWRLIASNDGREGSVTIHADASIYSALVDSQEQLHHVLDPKRKAYLHLVHGSAEVNGHSLRAGDALMFEGESRLDLRHAVQAEALLFDLR